MLIVSFSMYSSIESLCSFLINVKALNGKDIVELTDWKFGAGLLKNSTSMIPFELPLF